MVASNGFRTGEATEKWLSVPRRTAFSTDLLGSETDESLSIDQAYERCRRIAQEVARTFYYGSLFLPAPKRRASWALYAFCRIADDIADEPVLYPEPLHALDAWRHALEDVYAGRPRGPVMRAWADMLEHYPVPLGPALELLDGVEMDVRSVRYATFDELHLYCYRVAGTVGLLMSPVLGYQDQAALDAAVDLGIAMQLTNILRDVGADLSQGRVYLPEEDLAAFGYSRIELEHGMLNDAFVRLIEFQMARAEDYYRRGMRGIALLDADVRLAIALSATLYRRILGRIRRNRYDVFTHRAHVPALGKLTAVPGTWLGVRTGRI